MRDDFKRHLIRILVIVSSVNLVLFAILIVKINQLENEQQINQSRFSNYEQDMEKIKVDLATLSTYDLGDIEARLTKLEIIGNVWLESIANNSEVKIVHGKVISKDYYQELESGVPILEKSTDEDVTYQLKNDFKSYAMGQFGFVLVENEEFVQSVVLDDDFECTYILVNDEIKYIIMGSFTE